MFLDAIAERQDCEILYIPSPKRLPVIHENLPAEFSTTTLQVHWTQMPQEQRCVRRVRVQNTMIEKKFFVHNTRLELYSSKHPYYYHPWSIHCRLKLGRGKITKTNFVKETPLFGGLLMPVYIHSCIKNINLQTFRPRRQKPS